MIPSQLIMKNSLTSILRLLTLGYELFNQNCFIDKISYFLDKDILSIKMF